MNADRETGQKMSRRDFLQITAAGTAATAVAMYNRSLPASEPEPTQENVLSSEDYEFWDQLNYEAIQARIGFASSRFLDERELSEEIFPLENARVGALIKLNTRFAPDLNFALLTDSQNNAYGILWNVGCLREALNEDVGRTVITPGPSTGFLSLGVREIQSTPVNKDTRLEELQVQRLRDTVKVNIGGQLEELPLLTTRGAVFNNQVYECETPWEQARVFADSTYDKIAAYTRNFNLGETLESTGEFFGNAVGNLAQGAIRGVRSATASPL